MLSGTSPRISTGVITNLTEAPLWVLKYTNKATATATSAAIAETKSRYTNAWPHIRQQWTSGTGTVYTP